MLTLTDLVDCVFHNLKHAFKWKYGFNLDYLKYKFEPKPSMPDGTLFEPDKKYRSNHGGAPYYASHGGTRTELEYITLNPYFKYVLDKWKKEGLKSWIYYYDPNSLRGVINYYLSITGHEMAHEAHYLMDHDTEQYFYNRAWEDKYFMKHSYISAVLKDPGTDGLGDIVKETIAEYLGGYLVANYVKNRTYRLFLGMANEEPEIDLSVWKTGLRI